MKRGCGEGRKGEDREKETYQVRCGGLGLEEKLLTSSSFIVSWHGSYTLLFNFRGGRRGEKKKG